MALDEHFLAVGAIHGCPEQLEQILDLGRAFPQHQWVFLGDYINRGPDSERVLQRLQGLEAVFLLGNHEQRLLGHWTEAVTAADRRRWLDSTGLSSASMDWLLSVPRPSWETQTCLFVHGHGPETPARASQWVVHGHHHVEAPLIEGKRININTGCGSGGVLTAVALPERIFLQSSRSPQPTVRPSTRADLAALVDEEMEELPAE